MMESEQNSAGLDFQPPVVEHSGNLAQIMSQTDLNKLGVWLNKRIDEDKLSRSGWMDQLVRAFDLLGVGPQSEPDSTEYENSDTSNHTLMMKALMRFQSDSLKEMLPAGKICRAVPSGDFSKMEKEERAKAELEAEAACSRGVEFFTHYLTRRLATYVEDHDRVLFDTGSSGSGFKKIYTDKSNPDPVRIDLVPVEDFIISYNAKSLREGRITHEISMSGVDYVRKVAEGVYLDTESVPSEGEENPVTAARDRIQGIQLDSFADKDIYKFRECHCEMLITSDKHPKGFARPYVVTLDRDNPKVISIRRNWIEGDAAERRQEAFSGYILHPGRSSIYGWGFGTILGNSTEALRTGQRRGLESAYLQNHPAGFKKRDLTIRDDNERVVPGQLIDIDSPGERIADSIYLFEFKGPSPGLISLMEGLERNGEELAGISSMNFTDMVGGNTPVGTVLAVIEEANKFASAVSSRLYRGQANEYELIQARMIRSFNETDQIYEGGKVLKKGDLSRIKILPVMKPGQVSRHARVLMSEALLGLAEKHPDVLNKREAVLSHALSLGVEDLERFIVPPPEEAKPADAITEYNNALKGKPLKAGPAQNHIAHMGAHEVSIRLIQNSNLPVDVGEGAIRSLSAHMGEHLGLQMSAAVVAQMGGSMEDLAKGIPPEVENKIAPQVTQAIIEYEQKLVFDKPPEDARIELERVRGENRLKEVQVKGKMDLEKQRVADRSDEDQNDADNVTAIELQAMKLAGDRAAEKASPNITTGVRTGAPGNDRNPGPKG